MLTIWSPDQLTVVAGTDATSSSFGMVAMMSSSWIGLYRAGPPAGTGIGIPASIISIW